MYRDLPSGALSSATQRIEGRFGSFVPILYNELDRDSLFADELQGHINHLGIPLRAKRLDKHVARSVALFQRIHEGVSTTLPQIDLSIFLIIG